MFIMTQQPRQIENVFGLGNGEKVLNEYAYESSSCGCGPSYKVYLTDARIIQRGQEKSGCCTTHQVDSMLFLSDISTISNYAQRQTCNIWDIICCPCSILSCCFTAGKPISIRGAFGQEVFMFAVADVNRALADIPQAALPIKTAKSHY
ncbi:unnamed protein product [Rotaria socialis]|uniref:Uncharacterized protein n=2 Tax=Rotaria socialis TaxID=392032 RepID=A0A818V945_9BILA|nr:unnamed protein product [Rotaria socialis]